MLGVCFSAVVSERGENEGSVGGNWAWGVRSVCGAAPGGQVGGAPNRAERYWVLGVGRGRRWHEGRCLPLRGE